MMLSASNVYNDKDIIDNKLELDVIEDVQTLNGWVNSKDLKIGDYIIDSDNENLIIKSIEKLDSKVIIYFLYE